jgi:hypothetical protein
MNIKIYLNRKSIKNAINVLESQKRVLTDQAIPEYLNKAAQRIGELANENLDKSDVGETIKSYIKSNWFIKTISKSQTILYNMSWKSAYVEFGVGIVGQSSAHPNASETDWEYNLKTLHKNAQGGWTFSVDDIKELDLPQEAVIEKMVSVDGDISIYTKGTQGVWYLFNAMEDFKLREAKPLWEEIKQKYWS